MRKCTKPSGNGTNESYPFYNGPRNKDIIKIALRLYAIIIRSSKFGFFLQLFVSLFVAILPAATALVWEYILGRINSDAGDMQTLILPFVLMGILGGLSVTYYFFTEVVDSVLRNEIARNLQTYVHDKVQRLPVSYFEIPQLNDTLTVARSAFSYGPATSAAMSITGIFTSGVAFVATGMVLWRYNHILVVVIILSAIPNLLKLYTNKINLDFNLRTSSKRREAGQYIRYFTKYDFIKETQVWGAKDFFLNRWLQVIKQIKKEEVRINIKVIFIQFLMDLMNSLGYLSSILLGGYLLFKGDIGVGEFGGILYLIGQTKNMMDFLFMLFGDLHGDLSSIAKGFDFLDLKEEDRNVEEDAQISTSIQFNQVSFQYPLTDTVVLRNIDFEIKAGEIIALVGANGAGKSTFAKLLLGLLNPTSGDIIYDDRNISNFKYEGLHSTASAVFQDLNHYYMSINDNIKIGDAKRKDGDANIRIAAERLGLIDFIDHLPDGLNTNLGKQFDGVELSGGQWQLLALARGFYKNARLMVLDEPSSALDPFNEEALYHNFKQLCEGKTGLIITHRLGAASLADRIILLDGGNMIEVGSHDELMQKRGVYWKLYQSQAILYRD